MLENYDRIRDKYLANVDKNDMKSIMPLGVMDSFILADKYFSETVEHALLIERTYGEPIMTQIFDESEINSDTLKGILRSMHPDETPVLVYWGLRLAIKTTWGMTIKYWDDFFYDIAIIYVNQDLIYLYDENAIFKKINKLKSISGESIFDCLQKLEDNKVKKLNALDCLLETVPGDLHDNLYALFHTISEGFKAIENDEIRKGYMKYCSKLFWSNATELVMVCKPYSEKSLKYLSKDFIANKKIFDKPSVDEYYELLKNIIAEKISK